eukprot:353928-Chlamydomonas_euryale.AAC.9
MQRPPGRLPPERERWRAPGVCEWGLRVGGGSFRLRRGCKNGWMDGWMDGWADGQTSGWMDGWMDGGRVTAGQVIEGMKQKSRKVSGQGACQQHLTCTCTEHHDLFQ